MFKKMLKNERGLTLIELLAVVVILGIIAAIAVPSIGNVIQKSKDDAVHAESVQVLDAAKLLVATQNPEGTNIYSNIPDTTGAKEDLNEYLDGVDKYAITVTNTNGKYTYTNIKVIKGSKEIEYDDEAKLRSKTVKTVSE
ncbi:type IV pilin protein [Metabacillus idriensis]|uniref:type IV pilin protein n=1 Tax=Metabacillus idriensis TaxID=324768 RepID=UPI00174E94F3|nr:prepilin-type N-terminal cleavage/methylation domain-containing protein [Metabacillus idriensis]